MTGPKQNMNRTTGIKTRINQKQKTMYHPLLRRLGLMECLSMGFVTLPWVIISIMRIPSARSVLVWRTPMITIFLLSKAPLIIVFLLRRAPVRRKVILVGGPSRFIFHLLIVPLMRVPPSIVIWAPRMRPIVSISRTTSSTVSILLHRIFLTGAFFPTYRICFSSGRRRYLEQIRNQEKKYITSGVTVSRPQFKSSDRPLHYKISSRSAEDWHCERTDKGSPTRMKIKYYKA